MRKEYIPGWMLMLVIAIGSVFLSRLIVVGGKNPLEASVIAILLGIIIRNIGWVPDRCNPGIKAFEKVLIMGIVLIGASMDFGSIKSQGITILSVIILTMTISFAVIYLLSIMFKLPRSLAILLSAGTTICGGTAIAIISPLIKAKEEETIYAIGTVAIWGLIAIILYSKVAQLIGVSDFHFGVFAGTAIHSTPQVVGAAFIFSEAAGVAATMVKLVRNCFLIPVAFLISVWYSKVITVVSQKEEPISGYMKVVQTFPWFLMGYFLMAGFASMGYFSPKGISVFNSTGQFLILLGLAGIGLNTMGSSFKTVGMKPLIVGMIGSMVVAGFSIVMIIAFL